MLRLLGRPHVDELCLSSPSLRSLAVQVALKSALLYKGFDFLTLIGSDLRLCELD